MSKAYVLLSGGMDSATCLAEAKRLHTDVAAVSVHYGQLHSKEIRYAMDLAKLFGATHQIIDLSGAVGKGGLSDPDLVVPDKSYDELPEGISPTYVPFRNGLMLAALASIAQADPDAKYIYYGAHSEDAENDAYPDCSVEFITAMGEAIFIGTYQQIRLRAPLMDMTKAEVVQTGEALNVPWHMTWSCYKGLEKHCGTCPTCQSRIMAFNDAGVEDPTEYAND